MIQFLQGIMALTASAGSLKTIKDLLGQIMHDEARL